MEAKECIEKLKLDMESIEKIATNVSLIAQQLVEADKEIPSELLELAIMGSKLLGEAEQLSKLMLALKVKLSIS